MSSSDRTRRFEIIHWFNNFHFFDPQHSFHRKLWTSAYLSLESYVPTSEGCWCREFVEMKVRNLQSMLVCPIILWRSSLTRDDWISGWRSWQASRIRGCVWVLTFTRYMRWYVFRYVRSPRIEPSWIRWWRRRRWIYKNVSRYTMCSPTICWSLRLGNPRERLSIPPGSRKSGKNAGWLGTWDSPLRTDSASKKSLETFTQKTSFCSSWILDVNSLTCLDFQTIFFSKIHRFVTLELSSIFPSHEDFWYECHEDPDFVLIVLLEVVVDLAWITHTLL